MKLTLLVVARVLCSPLSLSLILLGWLGHYLYAPSGDLCLLGMRLLGIKTVVG